MLCSASLGWMRGLRSVAFVSHSVTLHDVPVGQESPTLVLALGLVVSDGRMVGLLAFCHARACQYAPRQLWMFGVSLIPCSVIIVVWPRGVACLPSWSVNGSLAVHNDMSAETSPSPRGIESTTSLSVRKERLVRFLLAFTVTCLLRYSRIPVFPCTDMEAY